VIIPRRRREAAGHDRLRSFTEKLPRMLFQRQMDRIGPFLNLTEVILFLPVFCFSLDPVRALPLSSSPFSASFFLVVPIAMVEGDSHRGSYE
jgi:hypothetical protein